jgi:hypothetical protein
MLLRLVVLSYGYHSSVVSEISGDFSKGVQFFHVSCEFVDFFAQRVVEVCI